jgi:hypothetical protein
MILAHLSTTKARGVISMKTITTEIICCKGTLKERVLCPFTIKQDDPKNNLSCAYCPFGWAISGIRNGKDKKEGADNEVCDLSERESR